MYYICYLIYDIRTKILHEPYFSIYTHRINVVLPEFGVIKQIK